MSWQPASGQVDLAPVGVPCSYARLLTPVTLSTARNVRAEATGIPRHGNTGAATTAAPAARRLAGVPGASPLQLAVAAGAELVLTSGAPAGHLAAEAARTPTRFTIFEGTSEIQRMIIGRVVTGLDVR